MRVPFFLANDFPRGEANAWMRDFTVFVAMQRNDFLSCG